MQIHSNLSVGKALAVIAFLFIAGFLLHLPAELGVSLSIPPDSQEYSFGLANLFEHGKFGFTLNGEWYPSRYAPWFSLFCLSPAYFLFGGDVLALHWAIVAFALAFLVISYRMARLAGLGRWSPVCAVLPLFIPNFVFFSRMVMTEIPYVALFAASALAFVKFAETEKPSALFCIGVGTLVAWTGAVRVTGLPMLVLYFAATLFKKCEWKRKLLNGVVMSLPMIAYVTASLMYNNHVFGTPFRNGYHYWVPVPCDFQNLTFNLSYAISNVTRYLSDPMMLMTLFVVMVVLFTSVLMLLGYLGGIKGNVRFLLLSGYFLFQGAVLFALYVGYYFYDVRFYFAVFFGSIPLFLVAVVKMADGVLGLCNQLSKVINFLFLVAFIFPEMFMLLSTNVGTQTLMFDFRFSLALVMGTVAFALLFAIVLSSCGTAMRRRLIIMATVFFFFVQIRPVMSYYHFLTTEHSLRISEAKIAKDVLPEQSVVIQKNAPSILDYFGYAESGIRHFPCNRDYDYASNMVAPTSLANIEPPPQSCWELIVPEYVARGVCRLPFPETFAENPSRVKVLMGGGTRVFVHKRMGPKRYEMTNKEVFNAIANMGLEAREFGIWTLPEILPNPVRHIYDRLVFPCFSMDSRPEVKSVYYEILPKGDT